MRLDKFITNAGLASRSECKRLVREGRVTVDGVTATDAALRVDTEQAVCLDGVRACYRQFCYLMMNKPAGYLSVTEDPRAPTVLELLPEHYRRLGLFPAGRLDKDSVGLLLLTSDGDFCHRVISPKSGIEKEYYIEVAHPFPQGAEALFAEGPVLEHGERCLPAVLIPSEDRCSALVRIREGKYHQVKRMALSAGTRVTSLKRLSIGALRLDSALEPGQFRELRTDEVTKVTSNRSYSTKSGS